MRQQKSRKKQQGREAKCVTVSADGGVEQGRNSQAGKKSDKNNRLWFQGARKRDDRRKKERQCCLKRNTDKHLTRCRARSLRPDQSRTKIGYPKRAVWISAQTTVGKAFDAGQCEEIPHPGEMFRFLQILQAVGIARRLLNIINDTKSNQRCNYQKPCELNHKHRVAEAICPTSEERKSPRSQQTANDECDTKSSRYERKHERGHAWPCRYDGKNKSACQKRR